jgi:Mg2+ and Co2+ transporter CorA
MLINCAAYQNGRRLADIEPSEIHHYLIRPDNFVWVALLEPDARALELMQAEFNLHPLAVEDARHGHQRPKIEEYGEVLFAVLHVIEPEGDVLRVGEMAIFVGRNYILSVRSGAEQGFQDVRVSDHLQRLEETIETIRETAATAISVNLSMVSMQQNETMKRLAAIAALVAVPTLIVGIYGMNFDYMPELRWRYGYALVLGAIAAVDAYIFYRLRRSGWL